MKPKPQTPAIAAQTIGAVFDVASVDPTSFSRVERAALGALLGYIRESQKGIAVALRPPAAERPQGHMAIDAATRSSLELLETQRGTAKGSLLHEIDACVTPAGSRLLARRLSAPLADPAPINARLDAVEALLGDSILTTKLRQALKGVPDLTRALTRLALDR
eukprot:gene64745-88574_t